MAATTKINDIVTSALRRQSRRNAEIETIIKANIKEFMKEEICTIFPFWFLRMEVGSSFLSTELPLSQDDLENFVPLSIPGHPEIDYWLDRGILRLNAGQAEYELFAPAETPVGDRNAAYWVGAKYQKPQWCKPVSLRGQVGPEIPINQAQVFLQHQTSFVEGAPCMVYMESGRERDVLRVTPTPDKSYLLAISWILAEPLNYYLDPGDVVTTNWTNKFLQEHQEIWTYVAMLKIAEYFDDLPNIEFYKKALFGEMNRSVGVLGGKLGDLKRSHQRKMRQAGTSIPVYKSNPMTSGAMPAHRDPWGRW